MRGEESRSAPASISTRASDCKFGGTIGSFADILDIEVLNI